MFEAIRSKLVGAWKDLRSRGLVSLFFFELVVVTLGVLLAQTVANWAEKKSAFERMELAKAKADSDAAAAMYGAKAYLDLRPCFENSMTTIMRAAALSEPVPTDLLVRPGLEFVRMHQLEPAQLERIASRYGTRVADNYADLMDQVRGLQQRSNAITEAYEGFARLDPANGPVGPDDRSQARQASSRIKALYVGIAINAENILSRGRALGIEPRPLMGRRTVADCDTLREIGRMTHPGAEER